MGKPAIAVDFDGPINGIHGEYVPGTINDATVPLARAALRRLRATFEVVIHTVRATDAIVDGDLRDSEYLQLVEYLARHRIPYDRIHTGQGKPHAEIYVDDKAVHFQSWGQTIAEIDRRLGLAAAARALLPGGGSLR